MTEKPKIKYNPELLESVQVRGNHTKFIHHPLLVEMVSDAMLEGGADMNWFIENTNARFEYAKERLAKAIVEKDIERFVFVHERAYRVDALFYLAHLWGDGSMETALAPDFCKDYNLSIEQPSSERWGELVGDVWLDQEFTTIHNRQWKAIFGICPDEPQLMMTADERKYYDKLPNKIKIYRGGFCDKGFAWTLSKEKAEWFANRWNASYEVFEKRINKDEAMSYFNRRGEDEILYLGAQAHR